MATTTALAPGLARKVKKILDVKTESPDVLSSLDTLSTFYNENTPAARRKLRAAVEQRSIQINQEFLQAADGLVKALGQVEVSLQGLSAHCDDISKVLNSSKAVTSPLLSEADKLMREQTTVDRKLHLVSDFLEQYQLRPEEIAALQGEEVGTLFFSALTRVRQIHENCRLLLRSHHQRAGLELMDVMSSYQETAYERLCRWVQAECRSIGEFDAPEVDPVLQMAVRALKERPILFKYCAEEVATARHNALFQRFISALTRGGPGGHPRPIDIHAHDPLRYAHDMLAWVHQSLASEKEFVVTLFGGDSEQTGAAGEREATPAHAQQLLDHIFESLCRPLRVRMEQILLMSPPSLLCYKLANLHSFYQGLVVAILGPGSHLSRTLQSCRDMAHRSFMDQLRAQGERILRVPPAPPSDLSPPAQVSECLQQLQEVCQAFESSLRGGDLDTSTVDEFQQVLAAMLDPIITMCERSAEALSPDSSARLDDGSRLNPAAYRMYLINCMVAIEGRLMAHPFTQSRAEQCQRLLEDHLAALVTREASRLLAKCGLGSVVDRILLYRAQAGSGDRPALATDPALGLPLIQESMRAFFVMVSSPDVLPDFLEIKGPRVRSEASARVALQLVQAYELVYGVLEDPTSGYLERGGASGVKHTPLQVRTILGVL